MNEEEMHRVNSKFCDELNELSKWIKYVLQIEEVNIAHGFKPNLLGFEILVGCKKNEWLVVTKPKECMCIIDFGFYNEDHRSAIESCIFKTIETLKNDI